MSRTKSFSIFLLKENITKVEDALIDNHNLERLNDSNFTDNNIPQDTTIFLSSGEDRAPWWKEFLSINKDLKQRQESALVFITCNIQENLKRIFVLSFGVAYHKLKEGTYEYDFGIKTTLNAIDPGKIKVTETLQPENAKRQRLQSPTASTLSFFDINRGENIIKTLAGKVREEYWDLFKSATGVDNLRITSSVNMGQMPDLLRELYSIYNKDTYTETFPNFHNITPIKDPAVKEKLEQKLIEDYNNDNSNIIVTVPEMITDYSLNKYKYKYDKTKSSEIEENDIEVLKGILPKVKTIDDFQKAKLCLLDEDSKSKKEFPIEKCLIFDCTYDDKSFHFCEGNWYNVKEDYIRSIDNFLGDKLQTSKEHNLPDYDKGDEKEYNLYVPTLYSEFTCLDTKLIHLQGQTKMEACDIIRKVEEGVKLYHIKIGTSSSTLSHLFNQGANAVDLLLSEDESIKKLKELIPNDKEINNDIDEKRFSIAYGIITHKNIDDGIKLLPLFSRISLYRIGKSLENKKTKWNLVFIKNNKTATKK